MRVCASHNPGDPNCDARCPARFRVGQVLPTQPATTGETDEQTKARLAAEYADRVARDGIIREWQAAQSQAALERRRREIEAADAHLAKLRAMTQPERKRPEYTPIRFGGEK